MADKAFYRVGVIGTGMISGTYIDTMAKRFDIIKVDAIADRHIEKAQKAAEKYGARACTIDGLLQDENIDIVVNLTPPAAHEEIISRILSAGKHAYTEKCFALDLATAQRMSTLADEKGLYLGTAPDTFFSGWAQTARQIIDSGRLGTITSFAMVGNRDNERMLGAMDYMNKPGGGVILDYSVYYLTMLVNLLGPVKRVSCNIKAPYPTHVNQFELSPRFGQVIDTPNESQFYSVLELEGGITGTLSINSDSVFFDQTYFAIYGNKGILYLGCPDWFNGSVSLYENTYDFAKADRPERIKIDIPFGYNVDSRGVGVADMAYAIRDGREMRASKERACHVLDVQECMVKSHEHTVKPSTVLPKLPYGMTVGAYIHAVDRLNPGCKIGKHIEEERRCYNMALGGKMCLFVEKAVDAYEVQGCDILLDLLVYPFLKQDNETSKKKRKPRKESIEPRKDNQKPRKEGDTDE